MPKENIMKNLEEISTKDLEIGSLEWEKAWTHNRKVRRVLKAMSFKSFGIFLLDRGYTHLTTEYEGAGDSGDAFYTEGFKSKKDFEARSGDYGTGGQRIGGWCGEDDIEKGTRYQKDLRDLYKTYIDLNPDSGFKNHDDDLAGALISMIDYDWYNNEGGQGEIVWYLKKGIIQVDGEQNYQGQYECSETYSLDGEKPKTRYKDIR